MDNAHRHLLYRWSSNTGTAVFIIQLQPKIYDFIMLTVRFLFISYVCSQIPVLLICCIEYNVIGLKQCFKQRRVLLCCSVCIAALVTPPDIGSQIAAWLPLYLVIELSLFYALIRRNYETAAATANAPCASRHGRQNLSYTVYTRASEA